MWTINDISVYVYLIAFKLLSSLLCLDFCSTQHIHFLILVVHALTLRANITAQQIHQFKLYLLSNNFSSLQRLFSQQWYTVIQLTLGPYHSRSVGFCVHMFICSLASLLDQLFRLLTWLFPGSSVWTIGSLSCILSPSCHSTASWIHQPWIRHKKVFQLGC